MKDKCVDLVTRSPASSPETSPEASPETSPESSTSSATPPDIVRTYEYNTPTAIWVFFSNPTELYPGPFSNLLTQPASKIYLGSAYNAARSWTLSAHNIKYVINVTAEIGNYHPDQCTYYRLPIRDNNDDDITDHLNHSYELITELVARADGNILVHCYMGASRSATVLAHYICRTLQLDPVTVISKMRDLRKNINPTQRFMNDLQQAIENAK